VEDENGEQMKDELESVTSSAEWFMQGWKADRMWQEVDSRDEVMHSKWAIGDF